MRQPTSGRSRPVSSSRAGRGTWHGDAVDGVDQPPERGEVDLHVVVDGDAEVLGDRADEQRRPALLDGDVDAPRRAGARDRHEQVAGQRQQRRPALVAGSVRRIMIVSECSVGVAADAHGVAARQVGGVVDADDQVVLRLARTRSAPRGPRTARPGAAARTCAARRSGRRRWPAGRAWPGTRTRRRDAVPRCDERRRAVLSRSPARGEVSAA